MRKPYWRYAIFPAIFTIAILWITVGPHFEGLNPQSFLTFLSGMLSGAIWGASIFIWSFSQ